MARPPAGPAAGPAGRTFAGCSPAGFAKALAFGACRPSPRGSGNGHPHRSSGRRNVGQRKRPPGILPCSSLSFLRAPGPASPDQVNGLRDELWTAIDPAWWGTALDASRIVLVGLLGWLALQAAAIWALRGCVAPRRDQVAPWTEPLGIRWCAGLRNGSTTHDLRRRSGRGRGERFTGRRGSVIRTCGREPSGDAGSHEDRVPIAAISPMERFWTSWWHRWPRRAFAGVGIILGSPSRASFRGANGR